MLYRKWRPLTFSDVVGQASITVTLKNEVKNNRLAHAYLFVGSRGTGKTSCAKILSKAVNCKNPAEGDPCNLCEICKGIDEGRVFDVVEIDAASNNGVDNIRELREEAGFTPAATKYRVYIIDEVHMLSTGAFNALLKTLEEPPAHVIFILATTEVHKLPATILSRCQRFDFKRISVHDIADRLLHVAESEQLNLTPAAAFLIAGVADGALRDALSILDRISSVSKDIDEEMVRTTVGLIGSDMIFSLYEAIEAGSPAEAVQIISQLSEHSKDTKLICDDLITHYRNLMLIKSMGEARDLIVCTDSDYEKLKQYSNNTELQKILLKINQLYTASEKIQKSNNKRAALEIAVISMSMGLQETAVPAKAQEKSLEPLPEPVKEHKPAAEKAKTVESFKTETEKSGEDGVFHQWPLVLADIKSKNRLLYSILEGSSAYLRKDFILIDSKNATFPDMIKQSGNAKAIKEALSQATGADFRIGIYKRAEKIKKEPLDDLISLAGSSGIEIEIKK